MHELFAQEAAELAGRTAREVQDAIIWGSWNAKKTRKPSEWNALMSVLHQQRTQS
jgi:hypothetical protein